MATRKKSIDFEQSLKELELLVDTMESGELSLEQALKAFEQGVKLTRECQQALQSAEQKVEQLSRTAADTGNESVRLGDDPTL